MRAMIGCGVVLLSVLGNASEAAGVNTAVLAENRGLSPIIHIMDIPYAPAQDAPIVLAQAATPSITPPVDFILNECQETDHSADSRSALRGVDPAGMLTIYIQHRDKRYVDPAEIKNLSLLQGTKHGKITTEVDNTGLIYYVYDPEPGYLGDDQAIFMAELQGKRYKIVVDIKVLDVVVENLPLCPPPQLIKVNGKPVSGSSSYDLNTIPVTFADLAGSALGQTNATGITLDMNAAGYNWFIDTTPWDNSEFLPTSNPNEWVAKAGSAAAGKMDMLSVLLHEQGHALGINHSADPNNYMGTTLTAGVIIGDRPRFSTARLELSSRHIFLERELPLRPNRSRFPKDTTA